MVQQRLKRNGDLKSWGLDEGRGRTGWWVTSCSCANGESESRRGGARGPKGRTMTLLKLCGISFVSVFTMYSKTDQTSTRVSSPRRSRFTVNTVGFGCLWTGSSCLTFPTDWRHSVTLTRCGSRDASASLNWPKIKDFTVELSAHEPHLGDMDLYDIRDHKLSQNSAGLVCSHSGLAGSRCLIWRKSYIFT